jgi:hypothetical protein
MTSGILDRLKDHVLGGQMVNPISQLSATGVPPHIVLSNEIKFLKEQNTKMFEAFSSRFDSLPSDLRSMLIDDRFVSPNADASLRIELDRRFNEIRMQIEQGFGIFNNRLDNIAASNSRTAMSADTASFQTWTWGERMHPVPSDFKFPTCNVQHLWELWHFGNASLSIRPYKSIRTFDVKPTDYSLLSKASKVIQSILNIIDKERINKELIMRSVHESREVFQTAFQILLKQLYPEDDDFEIDRRRPGSLSYVTFYDLIRIDNKRKRIETSNNDT